MYYIAMITCIVCILNFSFYLFSQVPGPAGSQQTNLLSLIDQYNKTIQQPTGEAPPIPPKRRTGSVYCVFINY